MVPRYELPVVPLVASRGRDHVNLETIKSRFNALCDRYRTVIVEGVGGLFVPLSDHLMLPELIKSLELAVLIVARPTLGTINHTLLTIDCARSAGLTVLGFVINRVTGAGLVEQTTASIITGLSSVPCFGEVEEGTGVDVDSCQLGNTIEIARKGIDWKRLLAMVSPA